MSSKIYSWFFLLTQLRICLKLCLFYRRIQYNIKYCDKENFKQYCNDE